MIFVSTISHFMFNDFLFCNNDCKVPLPTIFCSLLTNGFISSTNDFFISFTNDTSTNDFMFINNDLFTFSTNDISTYQYQRLLDNVPMIFMQSYQRLLLHKYPMIHYFQPTIFTLTSTMIFGTMIIQRFIINQPMIYTCAHQRFFVHY